VESIAAGKHSNRIKPTCSEYANTRQYIYIICACVSSFLFIITSLQTRLLPKTTCNPSKKLSPNIVTEAPPWVHPSLGVMCFIHGVATGRGENMPKRHKKKKDEHKIEFNVERCIYNILYILYLQYTIYR